MGAPLYRDLGYETIWHYVEYVRWPRPPKSLRRVELARTARRAVPVPCQCQ